MQINSDKNLVSRLALEGTPVRQDPKQPLKSANNVSAALDNGFGAILSKALAPVDDSQLIAQTRKDLLEGRLESDAAFEAAAENILKYGL